MNQKEQPAEEHVDSGESTSEGTYRLAGCLVLLLVLVTGTAVALLSVYCPVLPWWGWTGIGILVLWAATAITICRLLALGGGGQGVVASTVFAPFLALLGIMQLVQWQVSLVECLDPETGRKPTARDDPEFFRRYGCAAWAALVCIGALAAVLCIRSIWIAPAPWWGWATLAFLVFITALLFAARLGRRPKTRFHAALTFWFFLLLLGLLGATLSIMLLAGWETPDLEGGTPSTREAVQLLAMCVAILAAVLVQLRALLRKDAGRDDHASDPPPQENP